MRTSRDATTSKTTEHEDIEHASNQYESAERESRPAFRSTAAGSRPP